jgi:halogenation protein CepH
MDTDRFDAIVIGGGPAGATAATLIAMDGHKVLLLERDLFPRYHVGESLLPSTVHFVTALLGCREEVLNANFMVKYGGIYRWGNNPEPWFFEFKEKFHKADYAFQVERSKFDHILLNNAKRKGVEVREEHRVLSAVSDEAGRIGGVRFRDAEGQEQTAYAPYVLDGSGQAGLLANYIGKREYDEYFKHIAVYAYFENGKRFPEPRRRGAVLSAAFDNGWIWYIPISDTLTSVGAVVHQDQASTIRKLGAEKALSAYIEVCPMIEDFLEHAHRVTEGPYGEVRIIRDYSYHNKKYWAPGCALVGDSACFIDPILASGVHLASYGGLLAARAVNTCLRNGGGISEQAAFDEFEQRYRREFALFYRFLAGFYEMHHDEESYFWQAHKILQEDSVATSPQARESFIQLAAGLASSGEPLFQDGEAFVDSLRTAVKVTEHRITDSKGADLSDREQQIIEDNRSQLYREQNEMWEFVSINEGKMSPEEADRSAAAIFKEGLSPTADGLAWQVASASPTR